MDIYSILSSDHQHLRELIADIVRLPDERHAQRMDAFSQLRAQILAHNGAEEETFYVALRQFEATRFEARHSEDEHHEIDALMEDLGDDDLAPRQWMKKFVAFHVALGAHLGKEESAIFTRARAVLSDRVARQLGYEMTLMKKERQLDRQQAGISAAA